MAVTYYVALPFIRTDDGTAPGEAQECQSEAAAIRRAEGSGEFRGGRKVADEEIIGRPNIKAPIGAGLGASAILW